MNDALRELLSIILVTFCLVAFPQLWLIWVFISRTQPYDWQPSPRSKVTPLGVYGPVR